LDSQIRGVTCGSASHRLGLHHALDVVHAVDLLQRRHDLLQMLQIDNIQCDVNRSTFVTGVCLDILDIRVHAADDGGYIGKEALAIGGVQGEFDRIEAELFK